MNSTQNNIVIMVSNDHDQYRTTSSELVRAGFQILKAATAAEGFELAQNQRPVLFVSELAMTNSDGLELCRRVRASSYLASVPVLLLGEISSGSQIIADAIRCGADGYLKKPIDEMLLFKKCRALLDWAVQSRHRISYELIDAIAADISDVVIVFSRSGTVHYCNRASLGTLGYMPSELIEDDLFEYIHPADVDEVIEALNLEQPHRPGPHTRLRFRILAADGSFVSVDAHIRLQDDVREGPLLVMTFPPTTDFRGTSGSAAEKLSAPVSTRSELGVTMLSPRGRFLRSNTVLERNLGYSSAQFQNMTFSDLLEASTNEVLTRALGHIFTGQLRSFECSAMLKNVNGAFVPARINLDAMQGDETPDSVIGTIKVGGGYQSRQYAV